MHAPAEQTILVPQLVPSAMGVQPSCGAAALQLLQGPHVGQVQLPAEHTPLPHAVPDTGWHPRLGWAPLHWVHSVQVAGHCA